MADDIEYFKKVAVESADKAAEAQDVLREALARSNETNDMLRDALTRSNKTVDTLSATVEDLTATVEQLRTAATGVTCTNFALSTLFEELDTHHIKSYAEGNLPSDMLDIITDHGLKITSRVFMGSESISDYFSNVYPTMLRAHLEYDTRDTDQESEDKIDQEINDKYIAQYTATMKLIRAIGDKYGKEAAANTKKAMAAKKAAWKAGDKEGVKHAEETEYLIRKGLYPYVRKKFNELGARSDALHKAGKSVPPELISQHEHYRTFDAHYAGGRSSYSRNLGHAGMFLAYVYSNNMDISNVDVDVVKYYRTSMTKVRGIRKATVDTHTGTIKGLLKALTDDQVTKYRCKYLPPLGKLPAYKPPATEKEKEKEAFKLAVTISKKGVSSVGGDVSNMYTKLHQKTVAKNEILNEDLPLLEICIRLSRETGLRYTFLKAIQWGHFRIDRTKDAQMTDNVAVYRLDLVTTKKEREMGLYSLKRIVVGQKELPNNDFLRISRKLRNQIVAYRKDNTKIRDTGYVFDRTALLGKARIDTLGGYLSIESWRRILGEFSKTAGVNVAIEPMTFRNSYYTLMLKALRGDLSFKDWTGDDRETANTNYRAVSQTISLPQSYEGSLTYNQIITRVFEHE